MSDGLILLDNAATKRLIKAVGCDLDLLLHLGEWLIHLNMFSDAQVYDILKFVRSGVVRFSKAVNEDQPVTSTLCVCDSQWVSFSGLPKFLDTQTAEEIDELPHKAVTHIFCDLAALWDRMQHRQGRFHASSKNRSTDAANPAQTGQL